MFKFGKPKTPGYGLSKQFYLTVLAARATLPSIESVVHPRAADGAVAGFGVPLAKSASPDDLRRPMERGAYAVATRDRKTVLRCLVTSKEEAGFDPEAFANSVLAAFAQPELVARIRGTWTLVQLSYESYDPQIGTALEFLLSVAARFAQLSDGVIADPIAQRYFMPDELPSPIEGHGLDANLHVAVRQNPEGPNTRLSTLGMQKFGLPEFEIADVSDRSLAVGESFLLSLAQGHLNGRVAGLNDQVGSPSLPFQVCEGGLDQALWEGIGVWELVPPPGSSADDCLSAWTAEASA